MRELQKTTVRITTAILNRVTVALVLFSFLSAASSLHAWPSSTSGKSGAYSDVLPSATMNLLSQVSIDSFKRHISYLGSDYLKGRGTGTPGGRRAASYIANELNNLDITPIGDGGSFFQKIPMHGSRPLTSSRLTIYQKDRQVELKLFDDYLLYNSGAQTFVPKPRALVFAGYGIVAPEFDYNDYQSIDVADKIVVFLSGEPISDDEHYFGGKEPTIHSFPEVKQRVALARGAQGTIMIPNMRSESGLVWERTVRQFSFEDVTLLYTRTSNLNVLLNPRASDILFAKAAFSYRDVLQMDSSHTIQSFALQTRASFRGEFVQRDFWGRNVIGLLAGSEPPHRDSYLLLSAHYDHLGVGPPVEGDSIYNGVGDNAAGVAALLELARLFKAMPEKPKRSIVFLFLTAEEKGSLGAYFYVDHPVVPLYKTVANINIDGIAMFDTFDDFVGIGAEYSTFDSFLPKIANSLGLAVSPIPAIFSNSNAFGSSDQFIFARAGIPALLIMEGTQYRHMSTTAGIRKLIDWGEEFYHTPSDDLNQPMNFDAVRQHCQILFAVSSSLAYSDETIEWKEDSPFINSRLQSIAEKR